MTRVAAIELNLVTVAEAAEELDLTQHRVREFIRDGRLDSTRIGPLYFISRKDLNAFKKIKRKAGRPKSGKSSA